MADFLLTTFGSYGDINPILGLGLTLADRGHGVTVATSPYYREVIESSGLAFQPVRPDLNPTDPVLLERIVDPKHGTEFIFREIFLPTLREQFDDLMQCAPGADVLVSHPIALCTRVVAEHLGKAWAGLALAPISFFSIHDMPVFPPMPWMRHLRNVPGFNRLMRGLARRVTRSWPQPLYDLRTSLGLPEGPDPLYEGQFSPHLNLALFSRTFAQPQPDWPPATVPAGPVFHDRTHTGGENEEILRFLDDGEAPVVFTLGSAAVHVAGRFWQESIEVASRLERRAVLVAGGGADTLRGSVDASRVCVIAAAPFSELFPRAAAIVHSGGIGTTQQALRAGCPQLVVPFAHDQPDNASRVERLGVGAMLPAARYSASRAVKRLQRMLTSERIGLRAAEVGRVVQSERGAEVAADALVALAAQRE